MSVPFDRIGPTQVGRLAYQVIGSNGPINNPAGIRYMSPDDPALQSAGLALDGGGGVPGLMMWSSAAQFASLGLSAANLGVSIAVLSEVRQISRRLDSLGALMRGAVSALDRIESRLERIDVNVAEGNLRAGLQHVINSASGEGWLNLEMLYGAGRELDRFTDSLDGFGYGLAPTLRLSSDVRAMVVSCRDAFRGARHAAMQRHNLRVKGNALAVASETAVFDIGVDQLSSAVVSAILVDATIAEFADALGQRVHDEFFFADHDKANEFRSLAADGLAEQVLDVFSAENPLAVAIAETLSPLLPGLESEDELRATVDEYLAAWWGADARLLWELDGELKLYKHSEFWAELGDWHDESRTLPGAFEVGEVDAWIQAEELQVASRADG